MAVLARGDPVLGHTGIPNNVLNERKQCCDAICEKEEDAQCVCLLFMTYCLMLKVEVVSKECKLRGIQLFFLPSPRNMFAFNDIFIYKS